MAWKLDGLILPAKGKRGLKVVTNEMEGGLKLYWLVGSVLYYGVYICDRTCFEFLSGSQICINMLPFLLSKAKVILLIKRCGVCAANIFCFYGAPQEHVL